MKYNTFHLSFNSLMIWIDYCLWNYLFKYYQVSQTNK